MFGVFCPSRQTKKNVFSVQKIHFLMVYEKKGGGLLDWRQKTCYIFCRFLKAVFSDSGAIVMRSTFLGAYKIHKVCSFS